MNKVAAVSDKIHDTLSKANKEVEDLIKQAIENEEIKLSKIKVAISSLDPLCGPKEEIIEGLVLAIEPQEYTQTHSIIFTKKGIFSCGFVLFALHHHHLWYLKRQIGNSEFPYLKYGHCFLNLLDICSVLD